MSFNIYEDNRAGLMPQIQALIAPPASDKSTDKKPVEQHPYFKRPGRGHNHDLCDCCREGGDLICCDKCPSSFHLQCHDPPLEATRIPHGEWLCHKCKYLTNKGKEEDGSKPRNCMDMLIEAAKVINPKLFELPYELTQPCDFPGTDKGLLPYMRSHHHPRRPYSLSIAPTFNSRSAAPTTAATVNPPPTSSVTGSSVVMQQQPLGGRCYECRRSCQREALLKCDYCSLHWHLDCLRPPLAAPPAVRWMCPNHVEHTLDAKLLTSASATERTRIWNAFKAPVDQDAIKLAFFRKIQRKNPPFRVRVRHNRRKKSCIIPQMIKNHYRQPVALLPSLRDVIREETVRSRLNGIESYFQQHCDNSKAINKLKNVIHTKESQKSKCTIISANENELKQLSQNKQEIKKDIDDINYDIIKITQVTRNSKADTVKNEALVTENAINSEIYSELLHDLQSGNTVWKLDTDSEAFLAEVLLENERRQLKLNDDQKQGIGEDKFKADLNVKSEQNVGIMDVGNEENGLMYMNSVEALEASYLQLGQLDIHLLRVLALQRIQQLLSHTSPSTNPNMPMPSELLTPEDIERISKAFNGGVYNDVSQVPLPHHYPNNMTPEQTRQHQLQQERERQERIQQHQQHSGNTGSRRGSWLNGGKVTGGGGKAGGSCVRARAMLCPVVSKYFYNVRTQDVDAMDVRHDASFMGYRPTVSARFPEATAMRYRSITIGRGMANDLQLDRYGHCNYISAKHAVIFYDEHTKHYELLNYSLYGTSVNNVRYCNDTTVAGLASTTYCVQKQQPQTDDNAASTESTNNQSISTNGVAALGIGTGGCCLSSNSSLMEKQLVRDIIEKRRKMVVNGGVSVQPGQGPGRKIMVNDCKMAAMDIADRMECSCAGNPAVNNNIADVTATGPGTYNHNQTSQNTIGDNSGPSLGTRGASGAGWEGSAILSHGALIRFGCIAFVFSIVDCATV